MENKLKTDDHSQKLGVSSWFKKHLHPLISPQPSAPARVAPKLTVIVAFYNMRREAPRTLFTLSPTYQRGIEASEYQVIAIDNNSSAPLDREVVTRLGSNFEYHFFKTKSMSPAAALNYATSKATAPIVMLMIDGARMVSPGLLRSTLDAFSAFKCPFVYTLPLHLGDKAQNVSVLEGYNQKTEDVLLDSIDWQNDGYKLFSISNLENNIFSFFGRMPESNCFAIYKDSLTQIGGFDERFATSGGGLVNLEIFSRIVKNPQFTPVALIGEATFHQFHGGVSTNVLRKEHPLPTYLAEYEQLFGERYVPAEYFPSYWGSFCESSKQAIPGSNFRLRLKIANSFIGMHRVPEAETLLQSLLKVDNDDPEVNGIVGNLYLRKGNFSIAEQYYRHAIQHDHIFRERRFAGLGNALKAQGRLDEAAECYEIAISDSSASSHIYMNFGFLERDRGNHANAAKHLEKSIFGLGDTRRHSLITLGDLYVKLGREADAVKAIQLALASKPADAIDASPTATVWGNCVAATAYSKLGEKTSSREHCLAAYKEFELQRTAVSASLCTSLGSRLLDAGEHEKAREVLQTAITKDPAHAGALTHLVTTLRKMGLRDEAILALREAIQRKASLSKSYQLLSDIYLSENDSRMARVVAKRAELDGIVLPKPEKKATSQSIPISSEYRSLIFTHIQKCAGSSIRRLIAESAYYSGFDVNQIYVPGELGRSHFKNMDQLDDPEIAQVQQQDIRVFADHSAFGVETRYALKSIERPYYYTVLREPFDRFVSFYYFFVYNPTTNYHNLAHVHLSDVPSDKLEELILIYANTQVLYLSGSAEKENISATVQQLEQAKQNLELHYSAFGIFEQLDASVALLQETAPSWLVFTDELVKQLPKLNGTGLESLEGRSKLTPMVKAMFESHNRLDYQLYEFSKQLFNKRIGSL